MPTDPLTKTSLSYRFDDVVVEPHRLRLEKDGQPRKITPRAFDVLVYLIEHRGRIIEKQELFDEVWREKFVTDNALTRIVKEIRHVIGDDADAPRYIETIPKRGYRFIAEVNDLEAAAQREKDSETHVAARSEGPQAVERPEPALRPNVGLSASRTAFFSAIILGLAVVAAFIVWKTQSKSSEPQAPTVLRNMQLTTWPGLDIFPSLSPDGNSVAYSSDHSGSFEIYVRPLTPGAREIQITSDGQQNFEPAWSPDGKLIAYYSKNRGGIWLAPASGGAARQLTEFGSRPSWSPDGSLIAFQSHGLTDLNAMAVGATSPSTLWLAQAQGSDPKPITQVGNPPGGHAAPSWSPDGKRVVFIAYDGSVSSMWTLSLKDNELKRVEDSRAKTWAYDPIYSPDGERGAYLLWRDLGFGHFRALQTPGLALGG